MFDRICQGIAIRRPPNIQRCGHFLRYIEYLYGLASFKWNDRYFIMPCGDPSTENMLTNHYYSNHYYPNHYY